MTSTTGEPRAGSSSRPTTTSSPVWRVGAVASVAATVATVVFALCAKAIDIPLEIDGEQIPVSGFAMVTLFWSVVGTGLAMALARWAKRPARTFVVTTVVLTLVSFVPVATADATTATQVALALSHVLAAGIVIPTLALRLPNERERS
ncbi:MAG: DUF6069 family protein [Actinomycetota bacterium]